jgi:hypothetical protein
MKKSVIFIFCVFILFCFVPSSFSGDSNKVVSESEQPKEYTSPDKELKALVIPIAKKNREGRIEIRKITGELLLKKTYESADGEHGFVVEHAAWTPDSNYFVYGMYSSGGHQPWHSPIDFYYRKDNTIWHLDEFVEPVAETEFQVKPPNIVKVTINTRDKEGIIDGLSEREIGLVDITKTCDCSDKEAFTIHGRLAYYNGNPTVRIWIIGTKRILGVEECPLPDSIENKLNFKNAIYGDFVVCPLTKYEPGVMQIVKVKSASHLVIKKW